MWGAGIVVLNCLAQDQMVNSVSKLARAGIVEATAPGFFGEEKPHILTYNPGVVYKLLLPFLAPHLTVCNAVAVWAKHVAWILYAISMSLILSNSDHVFPDTEMGETGKVIPACKPGGKMSAVNKPICQLEDILTFWKGEFRFLIAFMLAGFVAASVKTWGARRTMYASLCGNMRNLTIKLAAYIPIDKADEQLMAHRKTLGRWVALAFEVAFLKSRGNMDSDKAREHLLSSQLMVDGEWEKMVPGDRHSTVFWWIHTQVVRMEHHGILAKENIPSISDSIGSMRGKANDLMSSLDLDKPIPYTSLCGLLVTINVFMMSTWKGIEWSIWMRSFGFGLLYMSKFWMDMLGVFVWNLSYKALYDLAYILHNPFGDREIDVAHEIIFKGLNTLQRELMEGSDHIPDTMMHDKPRSEKTHI